MGFLRGINFGGFVPIIFSGKELLEIVIQIEKNGFTFYSQVASKVADGRARELIEWLAQEEKRHIGRFGEMLSRFGVEELNMPPAEIEEYTLYLKALADGRVFTSENQANEAALGIKSEKDAIGMAIEFEKDSILFLHGMKLLINKSDIAAVDELVREEMVHLKKLLELKG